MVSFIGTGSAGEAEGPFNEKAHMRFQLHGFGDDRARPTLWACGRAFCCFGGNKIAHGRVLIVLGLLDH